MARSHTLASQLVKDLVLPGLSTSYPLHDPARLQPMPETTQLRGMNLPRCPGGLGFQEIPELGMTYL